MTQTTKLGLCCLAALAFFTGGLSAQAYQPPTLIANTTTHFPNGVEVVDLDLDGDQDLLGIALDRIVWYANDGSGSFGPEQLITASVNPQTHVLADMNGDGIQDLLIAEFSDNIKLLLGNGSTLDAPITLISTSFLAKMDAADLNADGFMDVLYCTRQEVLWLASDSTGSFSTPQTIFSAPFSEDYEDVVAADFDNDGDLDVAYAWEKDNKVVWQRNLGGGTFGFQAVLTDNFNNVSELQAADLDLDGDMEIIATSGLNTSLVGYYDNLGGGSFGPRTTLSNNVDGPLGMHIADATGNGYPDILMVSYFDREVLYFPNSASGLSSKVSIYEDANDNYVGMGIGDVDGDGFDDLVTGSEATFPALERYNWLRNAQGGCSSSMAPTGLNSQLFFNRVRLRWTEVDQSVGCQISATRTSPPGLSANRAYLGSELVQIDVPFSVLGDGTSWDWQLRCACTTSPLDATPFSTTSSFSVPALRTESDLPEAALAFPNPASDRVRLEGEGLLQVFSMLGQTMHSGRINGVLNLNTARWPEGIYLVDLEGVQQQLVVQR